MGSTESMLSSLIRDVVPWIPPVVFVTVLLGGVFVLSEIDWHVEGNALVLRWKFLFVLPVRRWRIPLSDIEEVRAASRSEPFVRPWGDWTQVVGPVLRRGIVLVVLRKRGWRRRLYAVAPKDPAEFVFSVRVALLKSPQPLGQ